MFPLKFQSMSFTNHNIKYSFAWTILEIRVFIKEKPIFFENTTHFSWALKSEYYYIWSFSDIAILLGLFAYHRESWRGTLRPSPSSESYDFRILSFGKSDRVVTSYQRNLNPILSYPTYLAWVCFWALQNNIIWFLLSFFHYHHYNL